MKKIVVTENNFESVLEKLQERCNKYKMLKFYRVLSEDHKEVSYKSNPLGFRKTLKKEYKDKDGDYKYKFKNKFYLYNIYVRVTKHHFREAYEKDKESYEAKYLYPRMKSLIHLDLSASSVSVIDEGDIVQFLPFGGFIVWTYDHYTSFDDPISIYKYIFFPDFIKGKIKNLEDENKNREKEWERDAEMWHSVYENACEDDY